MSHTHTQLLEVSRASRFWPRSPVDSEAALRATEHRVLATATVTAVATAAATTAPKRASPLSDSTLVAAETASEAALRASASEAALRGVGEWRVRYRRLRGQPQRARRRSRNAGDLASVVDRHRHSACGRHLSRGSPLARCAVFLPLSTPVRGQSVQRNCARASCFRANFGGCVDVRRRRYRRRRRRCC
jgi:hypothetical protein